MVCSIVNPLAKIDTKSAGHIHIGTNIIGENKLYWYNLIKLWTLYEHVIYRFGYGEYLTHFPFITYSAKPIAKTIFSKIDKFDNDLCFSIAAFGNPVEPDVYTFTSSFLRYLTAYSGDIHLPVLSIIYCLVIISIVHLYILKFYLKISAIPPCFTCKANLIFQHLLQIHSQIFFIVYSVTEDIIINFQFHC